MPNFQSLGFYFLKSNFCKIQTWSNEGLFQTDFGLQQADNFNKKKI